MAASAHRSPAGGPPGAGQGAGQAAVAGWVLFDWAAQPYFTLITTFVFAPFFAAQVAANAAEGQGQWGFATAAAGLIIAVLSPLFGAIADAQGRRKPWILLFSVMVVAASLALWFVRPGEPYAVVLALTAFAIGTVGAEFATVFTNAMIPDLAPPARWGRLSGTGWAVGYVGGLVTLVVVLGLMAGDPASGLTLIGISPILGLDPAAFEGDRASGPFTALWYALFVLPLFLFVPERPTRMALAPAVRAALSDLAGAYGLVRRHRQAFRYLLARMLYTDGLVALFAFGGIYAAGIFGWGTIEIGLFGILITVAGAVGAYGGGHLDDLFGPKRVVMVALALLILASLGILSVDRTRIFFVVVTDPPGPGTGLFSSRPEQLYIALGALIGIAAGPLQAAGRTLLARLSPADKITEFFGFYALAGKVTSFLGPLAVGAATLLSGDQRLGISVLLVFFLAGAALLAPVRVPPRQRG